MFLCGLVTERGKNLKQKKNMYFIIIIIILIYADALPYKVTQPTLEYFFFLRYSSYLSNNCENSSIFHILIKVYCKKN